MSHSVKNLTVLFLLLVASWGSYSQTTYLPLGSDEHLLLDRMETMSGRLSDSIFLSARPEMRKRAFEFIDITLDSSQISPARTDAQNCRNLLADNSEWATPGQENNNSKHPLLNRFYSKKDAFFYVKSKDFFFVLNPVLNIQALQERDVSSMPILMNAHGAEARGWIAKKIGFYTNFTDNQEMTPSFVTNYIESRRAAPGADFFTKIGNRNGKYDYLQGSGYIDFALVKDHVNATFGSGKHFIGDGITSLFLSDFSSNYPFLKLTSRVWKFNYQNLFLKLTPQFQNKNGLLAHKYAAMHLLEFNASRKLNVGFFESVIFDRPDNFDISYMNPIIFYRAVEHAAGSPDNELLGFNYKFIPVKSLQFYGQFLLDEFTAKEFFGNKGYWANKWGLQLGAKYFNVFGIENLDMQLEVNAVRPYTYSHSDTISNYSNYNQPLAHPLGAGFEQAIGLLRYQPSQWLTLCLKGMYYLKGADTGNVNFGNNIFDDYSSRVANYGVFMINGVQTSCTSVNLNVTLRLRSHLFLDVGGTNRMFKTDSNNQSLSSTGLVAGSSTTTYFYVGLRLNAFRRDYDFF